MQVTKLSLRPVPNPHTNQVLHEAEVWIKDGRGRRKLDLMVKYPSSSPSSSIVGNAANCGGWLARPRSRMGSASDLTDAGSSSTPEQSTPTAFCGGNNGWVLDGTNNEMERESRAYAEVVADMWRFLHSDKNVIEPEQYLCLPQRYLFGS